MLFLSLQLAFQLHWAYGFFALAFQLRLAWLGFFYVDFGLSSPNLAFRPLNIRTVVLLVQPRPPRAPAPLRVLRLIPGSNRLVFSVFTTGGFHTLASQTRLQSVDDLAGYTAPHPRWWMRWTGSTVRRRRSFLSYIIMIIPFPFILSYIYHLVHAYSCSFVVRLRSLLRGFLGYGLALFCRIPLWFGLGLFANFSWIFHEYSVISLHVSFHPFICISSHSCIFLFFCR